MHYQKPTEANLTIVVVSHNSRELTLRCLETLYETTRKTSFHTIVFDNNSQDGTADAVAQHFPRVELIHATQNIGFARANNEAIKLANTEWLLLLNPDTEVHEGAIDNLLAFGIAVPGAGIYGGRTVYPDGSLNMRSCWNKTTVWGMFCETFWLTELFPNSSVFNSEVLGGWKRDSVRRVDIVSGCFLMIRRSLWNQLEGFNPRYFMYGEEADLCLRAARLGYRPMITPHSQIMHLVGATANASAIVEANKIILLAKARVTLIKNHWQPIPSMIGVGLSWLWGFNRFALCRLMAALSVPGSGERLEKWATIWNVRKDWLSGY